MRKLFALTIEYRHGGMKLRCYIYNASIPIIPTNSEKLTTPPILFLPAYSPNSSVLGRLCLRVDFFACPSLGLI